MLNSSSIAAIVTEQLSRIHDPNLAATLQPLLVEPAPILRDWDYGAPGEQFVCWSVIEHPASNTGIAYCEQGFGPTSPWGLVFLSGSHMSIGMDSAWYCSLEGAFRESMAWDGINPLDYESE
jgi:hypothetical protein